MAASALGLDSYITRELLQRPQIKNSLLGTAFAMKLSAGIIILPLIYITYFIVTPQSGDSLVPFDFIAIVSFVCVIQSFTIIDSYFQSQVQGKKIMIVQVVANIVSALVKVLMIFAEAPLIIFVWAILADAVFLASGYLFMYSRSSNSIFQWRFEKVLAKDLLADRKSTRLNSSHVKISYAVFCLKKKII